MTRTLINPQRKVESLESDTGSSHLGLTLGKLGREQMEGTSSQGETTVAGGRGSGRKRGGIQ